MSAIALGTAVAGAATQVSTANKAAKAQEKAGRNAQAVERGQQMQQRADQATYRQLGSGAANKLADLFGIGGVTGYDDRQVGSGIFKPSEIVAMKQSGMSIDDILKSGVLGPGQGSKELRYLQEQGFSSDDVNRLLNGTFSPLEAKAGRAPGETADFSDFYASPGYQFQLNQGKQLIERSAAAKGGLASGNTLAELTRYGEGVAAGEYNNYVNQLMGLTGTGQNATNALMGADMVTSGRIADSEITAGNARASGVVGAGNAINDLIGEGGAALSGWWNKRKQTPAKVGIPYGGTVNPSSVRYA